MAKKSYTKENEKILEAWENDFVNSGDVSKFSYDGIMYMGEMKLDPQNNNPNCYWRDPSDDKCSKENKMWTNCPVRFLFLTKDQNGGAWDARKETYCDAKSEEGNYFVWKKYSFNRRMAYIFRGLVAVVEDGKFMSLEEVKDDQQECVKVFEKYPVARINCKKEGGGPRCHIDDLFKHMDKYQKYLIEQINNLEADVFICCEHHDSEESWFGTKGLGNIFIEFLNDNGYNFKYRGPKGIWIDDEKKKSLLTLIIYQIEVKDIQTNSFMMI